MYSMSKLNDVSKDGADPLDESGWESNSSLESDSEEVITANTNASSITPAPKAPQPTKSAGNSPKNQETMVQKESHVMQNVETLDEQIKVPNSNKILLHKLMENPDDEFGDEPVIRIKKKSKNTQEDKKCLVKKIKKKPSDSPRDDELPASLVNDKIQNSTDDKHPLKVPPVQSVAEDVKAIEGSRGNDLVGVMETKAMEENLPKVNEEPVKDVAIKKVIKIKKKKLKPKIDLLESPPQTNEDKNADLTTCPDPTPDDHKKLPSPCLQTGIIKDKDERIICDKDTQLMDSYKDDDVETRVISETNNLALEEANLVKNYGLPDTFKADRNLIESSAPSSKDEYVSSILASQLIREMPLSFVTSKEGKSSIQVEGQNEHMPVRDGKVPQLENDKIGLSGDFDDDYNRIPCNNKVSAQPHKPFEIKDHKDDMDADDDVIENITKYLAGKLSQKPQAVSNLRNGTHTEKQSWMNGSDDEFAEDCVQHYPDRNILINKRMNYPNFEAEVREEGLMDRIRRERNAKAAQPRNEMIYQPKRRGDTDEKVIEKTKHVRGLIDKQVAVLDNLKISIQRFSELESLIKEIKVESLQQRVEHENLEEHFNLACKKYDDELNVAAESLRVQKKMKLAIKDEIKYILQEWLDSENRQTSSREAREKLKNQEFDVLEHSGKITWQNFDSTDQNMSSSKESNKKRTITTTTKEAEQVVKDPLEETDMASLSTNDFINRIRNKYALPAPKFGPEVASNAHPPNSQIWGRKAVVPEQNVMMSRKNFTGNVESTDLGKGKYKHFQNAPVFEDIRTVRSAKELFKVPPRSSFSNSTSHYFKRH